MPVALPPTVFTCPACGWTKTLLRRSDAMMVGINHFVSCPTCGHKPLNMKTVGTLKASWLGLWSRGQR